MHPVIRSLALALACVAAVAHAGEEEIRKNLPQRLAKLPKIDSVAETPIPGVYEVVVGGDIIYTDAQGDHVINGQILKLQPDAAPRNLTEERQNKLANVDFSKLPLKDAIVWKSGTGKRRIAVFADPNCGYCKKFERELQQVKDVTVYTFLIPILGGDSPQKLRDIWCAKDNTAAWTDWMLNNVPPKRSLGQCDTPQDRNMQLAQKHRVRGTPAIVFEDNTVVPGMLDAAGLEKRLASTKKG